VKRDQLIPWAVVCAGFLAVMPVSAQTLTVVTPASHFESAPLSSIHENNGPPQGPTEIPHHPLPLQANYRNGGGSGGGSGTGGGGSSADPVLQTALGPFISATAGIGFDGMSVNQGGYIPSDNNIAVGPNHIVETVNAAVEVYSKTGTLLQGPLSLRSLWSGLGGECAANNGGDPVVQYDKVADRWIITQLGSLSNPYAECIAVSATNDPTGSYHLWSYSFGSNLNDYPKFGVWPTASNSAYLGTYNLFSNGQSFAGAEICAYDRQAMLAGATSPKALCYTGISGASYLPSDLDGAAAPLDGTPAYFVDLYSTSGALGMYKMYPNFSTGTASLSFSTIGVASFTQASSVPQPGTSRALDSLSDRLMYRLAFRRFSDHESMVVTHSVATGGVAGARWYELQGPASSGASFTLAQQSTFAPGDGIHRWMGSIAMDQAGDMALGYSASNGTSQYPSVRYTGRTPSDPANTMETEASIKEGAGSQTGYTRWGDYSSMRIDPSDDCTFWYVNEYLPVSSSYGWYTHIGSFKFSGCGGTPTQDFSLSASPTSITVAQGQPGTTSTITVNPSNGFSGDVSLAVTAGCPTNATCTFSPTTVTGGSGSSTLTVTAASSTLTGTYPLTITGMSGSLTHTTTVSLTVNPPPDFSISASPTSLSLTLGQTGNSTITVTSLYGFGGSVGLSVSGCPTNATCGVSPGSVTGSGTATLTVITNSTTATGGFTLTVTGNSASLSHFVSIPLTVSAPTTTPDFTITVSGAPLTVKRGSSGSVTVNVAATGGSSSVTLSTSGVPSKVSTSFSSNPVTATGSSTLTFRPNRRAATGTYTITVTGNNGTFNHSTTFSLTIN
jgi:hypothetical protein